MGIKLKFKNSSGFTLVEAIISVAISVIIIAAIYSVYKAGNDIWDVKRIQADLQAEGRTAMVEMAEELKQTTSSQTTILAAPANTNILFHLPLSSWNGTNTVLVINNATGALIWDAANTIQYQLANDVIAGQKILVRLQTNATTNTNRTLARDASSIQFINHAINNQLYLDELKIILTLNKITPRQRNISITLSSIIRMRN